MKLPSNVSPLTKHFVLGFCPNIDAIAHAVVKYDVQSLKTQLESLSDDDAIREGIVAYLLRDILLNELLKKTINVSRLLEIVDFSIQAAQNELLCRGAAFALLCDIVDIAPSCYDLIVNYMCSKTDVWQSGYLVGCRNAYLRTINKLFRLFDESAANVRQGEVIFSLTKCVPFTDKSALNIPGAFNTSNCKISYDSPLTEHLTSLMNEEVFLPDRTDAQLEQLTHVKSSKGTVEQLHFKLLFLSLNCDILVAFHCLQQSSFVERLFAFPPVWPTWSSPYSEMHAFCPAASMELHYVAEVICFSITFACIAVLFCSSGSSGKKAAKVKCAELVQEEACKQVPSQAPVVNVQKRKSMQSGSPQSYFNESQGSPFFQSEMEPPPGPAVHKLTSVQEAFLNECLGKCFEYLQNVKATKNETVLQAFKPAIRLITTRRSVPDFKGLLNGSTPGILNISKPIPLKELGESLRKKKVGTVTRMLQRLVYLDTTEELRLRKRKLMRLERFRWGTFRMLCRRGNVNFLRKRRHVKDFVEYLEGALWFTGITLYGVKRSFNIKPFCTKYIHRKEAKYLLHIPKGLESQPYKTATGLPCPCTTSTGTNSSASHATMVNSSLQSLPTTSTSGEAGYGNQVERDPSTIYRLDASRAVRDDQLAELSCVVGNGWRNFAVCVHMPQPVIDLCAQMNARDAMYHVLGLWTSHDATVRSLRNMLLKAELYDERVSEILNRYRD
ncbi:efThoc1 and Death domain containing protein [Trichuris trichiura]|uniref:EfThoc1 and Death domain containing protein n=1 Tax=Trichuris trichiura TaxID=36087 RepID=A0A077ZCM8_TRITR|nr:efThoc1 and Death domain containing protein [Trichuris trichiura]